MVVLHSFLKSGHYVTANALAHSFMKMYFAVRKEGSAVLEFSPDAMASFLGSSLYPGLHFAHLRFAWVMFKRLAAKGELSYSFSRRLSVHGPGVVAQYLLAQVLKALADAKFFEFTNKQKILDEFLGAYQVYMLTASYETPYAKYMYGQSRGESIGFKNLAAQYMPFAAAISGIMPDSTFNFSVALKRDAGEAAKNTITSVLEVKAFVLAYKGYIAALVRGRLHKEAQAASGGSTVMITEA